MEVNNSVFWDIAYRDNAPALLGVLRRYVKDTQIVQDLLHDVFITAIDKYDSYSGRGSFEGWLYKIAVNTALMYLRNERINLTETQCVASLQVANDDTDDAPEDEVKATINAADFSNEELIAAIDRLPEHHKLVFNMYVMDDFSHKQIAAELNISRGTSKSHLARARKKIQQILYNDAMNRKKKKERRRTSAFLLLFPAKEHYIDKLYREGLSNFTIPPTRGSEFISAAIEQQATTAVPAATTSAASIVSQTTFWGSKLSYMAACCGTAAITGTVCWLSMSGNSPLNRDNDRMNGRDAIHRVSTDDRESTDDCVSTDAMNRESTDDCVSTDAMNRESTDDCVSTDAMNRVSTDDRVSTDAINRVSTDDRVSTDAMNRVSTDPVTKKTVPVVVKKQIIQHQTVVVRDTVFILE